MKKILLTILFLTCCVTAHANVTVVDNGDGYRVELDSNTGLNNLTWCGLAQAVEAIDTNLVDYVDGVSVTWNPNPVVNTHEYVEIEIESGGVLEDYTDGLLVEWKAVNGTETEVHLDLQENGTLIFHGENIEFDFDGSDINKRAYVYMYGYMDVGGTEDSWMTWGGFRNNYVYTRSPYTLDLHYINFNDFSYETSYPLYFQSYSTWTVSEESGYIDISHINIQPTNAYEGYALYFDRFVAGDSVNISDVTVTGCHYGVISYGSTFTIRDSKFAECVNMGTLNYGSGNIMPRSDYTLTDTDNRYPTNSNNLMVRYIDCEYYDNDADAYQTYCLYGSTVGYEGCTFNTADGTGNYGIRVDYDSRCIAKDNDFVGTFSYDYLIQNGGSVFNSKDCMVTVKDQSNVPIEGAQVIVRNSKFRQMWLTNTDGEALSFGGDICLVPYEEDADNTNDIDCSDTDIIVIADGYNVYESSFDSSIPQSIVINLEDEDVTRDIIINNSTIRNSTIG